MSTPRQLALFALFEAQKYPPEASAAWVGQWSQEVGINIPTAFRHGPLDHGSQGGPQWRDSEDDKRLTHYEDYVIGLHPELVHPGMTRAQIDVVMWDLYGRMDYQVAYCAIECRTHFPKIEAALRRGGDIDTLTDLLTWHFEIPAVATARADFRRSEARKVFAAAAHIGTSPATQANVDKTRAQAKIQVNNTNAGGGIVLGGIVAGLHWMGGMPSHMAFAAGAGVLVLVLYSLYAAQKAAQEAGVAGAQAAASAGKVVAPTGPVYTELNPVPEPKAEPAHPGPAPEPIFWVWNEKLRLWDMSPKPPEPAPEDLAPPPPPHPLMSDDIKGIVDAVVSALKAEIDEGFKEKV